MKECSVIYEIIKHIKIYSLLIRLNLMSIMEYRANFLIGILVEMAYLSVKILYLIIVYNVGVTIDGYSPDYITLYVGTFSIISAFYNGLFMDNFFDIPVTIRKGNLDLLIIKPVSLQFILTLKRVNFSMLISNIIAGIAMVFIACMRLEVKITFSKIIGYMTMLTSGIIISYFIFLAPIILSFWIGQTSSLLEITDSAWGINSMPMMIYSKPIQRFCTFVIPIFVIANYPSLLMFGELNYVNMIVPIIAPILLVVIFRIYWGYAIRSYTSANM